MGDGAGKDGPESFTVPPGIPDAVSKAVRALHSDAVQRNDTKYIAVLRCLVADPRAQRAWAQLVKRTRKENRSFLHPAEPAWDVPDNAVERQDRAIRSLVYLAVNLAMDRPSVITGKQVETARRRALGEATSLRAAAGLLHTPASIQANVDAARDRETTASLLAEISLTTTNRMVVERDTGDAQARCFAILFAEQCRRLFGTPLYGVTAAIASVALGRALTTRTVRDWANTPRDLCR
jgi:hypothetical protein